MNDNDGDDGGGDGVVSYLCVSCDVLSGVSSSCRFSHSRRSRMCAWPSSFLATNAGHVWVSTPLLQEEPFLIEKKRKRKELTIRLKSRELILIIILLKKQKQKRNSHQQSNNKIKQRPVNYNWCIQMNTSFIFNVYVSDIKKKPHLITFLKQLNISESLSRQQK